MLIKQIDWFQSFSKHLIGWTLEKRLKMEMSRFGLFLISVFFEQKNCQKNFIMQLSSKGLKDIGDSVFNSLSNISTKIMPIT